MFTFNYFVYDYDTLTSLNLEWIKECIFYCLFIKIHLVFNKLISFEKYFYMWLETLFKDSVF